MWNINHVIFRVLILFEIYHRAFYWDNSTSTVFIGNHFWFSVDLDLGKMLFTECICQSRNCSIVKCPPSREQLLQVLHKQLLRLLILLITIENSVWYPNYVCYKEHLCQSCQQQAAFYIPPPLPF